MKNSSREQDEKFLSSRQENIRLAIALERFFEYALRTAFYMSGTGNI